MAKPLAAGCTEEDFAAVVDRAAMRADAAAIDAVAPLLDLLREDHPCYAERGTTTVVRMRGWVLLALARVGVSSAALLVVLEELDAGVDPYLVAAAARALRSYNGPRAPLTPFVLHAIGNIRYRDEPVCLDAYGAYSSSANDTGPVAELLQTLAWIGPDAASHRAGVAALLDPVAGLPAVWHAGVQRIVTALPNASAAADDCCSLPGVLRRMVTWTASLTMASDDVRQMRFEDQSGSALGFDDVFVGKPALLLFFYTRCDNPQKCSLTVTKLARVQRLLAERGILDRVRTIGLTYDPAFDTSDRLRGYGAHRGVVFGDGHWLLRATRGMPALCQHLGLGVNFIGSVVNHHRIEAHVLDAAGRQVVAFARIHWDEAEVVAALEDLVEQPATIRAVEGSYAGAHVEPGGAGPVVPADADARERHTREWKPRTRGASWLATCGTLALAALPKCPVCWGAYASALGIAGLALPLATIRGLLVAALILNAACLVWRGRTTGRTWGSVVGVAGAMLVLVSQMAQRWDSASIPGAALVLAGSVWSALPPSARGTALRPGIAH